MKTTNTKTHRQNMENTKYHGWTNWDTWNCNLWLTNDEFTYRLARHCLNVQRLKEVWQNLHEGKDGINTENINFHEIFESINEP